MSFKTLNRLTNNLFTHQRAAYATICQKSSKIDYDFSKILILNKISRYEFEKKKNPTLSDRELKEKLLRRGSNFERLVEAHNTHCRSLEKILNTLKQHKIDFKVTQRFNYNYGDIDWANCILTTGGDGTFLLASAKVNSNVKPVIGVNTDVSKCFAIRLYFTKLSFILVYKKY
jgi:NAD+ kinase